MGDNIEPLDIEKTAGTEKSNTENPAGVLHSSLVAEEINLDNIDNNGMVSNSQSTEHNRHGKNTKYSSDKKITDQLKVKKAKKSKSCCNLLKKYISKFFKFVPIAMSIYMLSKYADHETLSNFVSIYSWRCASILQTELPNDDFEEIIKFAAKHLEAIIISTALSIAGKSAFKNILR